MNEISTRDARRLLLKRQGLLENAPFGRGKNAVQKAIEQLGYVQIDTISVVDRAHHHVLKSRVPNYTESMLARLQGSDRTIFEYWAHAAAYLPMKDYRFYQPMMVGWREQKSWDEKLAGEIRRRLEAEGPLQSRHFEDPRASGGNGWWDWKPAKHALEHMFLAGEIMVTRRDGFQKVYDLARNVLPPELDTTMPGHDEWLRFICRNTLRSLGIATLNDVAYARTAIRQFTGRAIRNELKQTLDGMVEDGEAINVRVGDDTWYADPALFDALPIRIGKKKVSFLSPFDNVVINRARLTALFDFDYQIECYVPAPKRKYGYFCLPILWGDELIGRMDAKAVRNTRELVVNNLFFEPRVKLSTELKDALREGIDSFARQNECDTPVQYRLR